MGNCQAAEAAAVVIQHPGGRVERLYWPTSAEEVMKSNPGHYVAVVTLYISQERQQQQQPDGDGDGSGGGGGGGTLRFTRVRLLKPRDTLLLGQVYRLLTSQEVTKALRARKHEKIQKAQAELIKKQQQELIKKQQQQELQEKRERLKPRQSTRAEQGSVLGEHAEQATKQDRDQQKSMAPSAARSRHWRPSLQSISEAGS